MKRLLALGLLTAFFAGCGGTGFFERDSSVIDAALEDVNGEESAEDTLETTPVSEGPTELPDLSELDGEI